MPTAHLDSRFSTPGAGPVALERVLQGREGPTSTGWSPCARTAGRTSRRCLRWPWTTSCTSARRVRTYGQDWRFEVVDGAFVHANDSLRGDDPGSAHVFAVVPRSAFGKGEPHSETRFTFPSGGGAWGHPRGSEGA
jgi:hypothetical protein